MKLTGPKNEVGLPTPGTIEEAAVAYERAAAYYTTHYGASPYAEMIEAYNNYLAFKKEN